MNHAIRSAVGERAREFHFLRGEEAYKSAWKPIAVLDIGCGIGRIERALASHVGAITGIDLSPGMVAEARRRCRGLPNVTFQLCNGRDLADYDDQSVDLVLAVDSFPCLVAVDLAIAEAHMRDAARLCGRPARC
jgi:ubiquinone/menaquinone biosynthesis C-methylase UbiE